MRRVAPKLLAAMLACMAPSMSLAQPAAPDDDLVGDWVLPENGAVIHTYRCEDAFCAQIVKVRDPGRRDSYNSDPVLRRRPILGIVIATNLRKKGPNIWEGKLYNTLNGYTYNGTLKLIDRGRFTFDGCLVSFLFCHSKTYYRVDPPAPPKQQKPPRQRAASRDRASAPAAKAKPVRKAPSSADFDAFLKERSGSGAQPLNDQQRQELYKDFLTWWITR